MTARASLSSQLADERGAITVTVALIIPVLIAFLALVVVGGQWYGHRQHLQTQVDAAALAAAQDLVPGCEEGGPVDDAITARVDEYGGADGAAKNPQVENASAEGRVKLLVNSPTYPDQSTSDDGPSASPCATGIIDVKATEKDLESILPIGGIVPFINANARVQLFEVDTLGGNLPIGVPEPAPKSGRVYLVDEDTGQEIAGASQTISKTGVDGAGNNLWTTSNPVSLTVGSRKRIGVRVVLSGQAPTNPNATTCGAPLVECYDASSDTSTTGLAFIQGWSNNGSGAQPGKPLVRSVDLQPVTCTDAYFVVTGNGCSVRVHAKVDFGPLANPTNTATQTPAGVGAKLRATVDGTTYDLTYSATTQDWMSGPVTVGASKGPLPVTLAWAEQYGKVGAEDCKTSGGGWAGANKCQGTFAESAANPVQRVYSGNSNGSGPIQNVFVCDASGTSCGINSLRQSDTTNTNSTYELTIKVSVQGTLKNAQSLSDPLVTLRTSDQNQTQALDCDPDVPGLSDQIAQGCEPSYKINNGTVCPTPAALKASPQPWQCVAIRTGAQTNEIAQGLNMRILGDPKPSTCSNPTRPGFGPNLYRRDFLTWSQGDPRIIQVLLTPFGSFAGNGAGTVPVSGFANFYVTGWSGQGGGFSNPCQTTDIPSDPELRDDPTPTGGYMVGHFIGYAVNSSQGSGGQVCDPAAVSVCVPVLTR